MTDHSISIQLLLMTYFVFNSIRVFSYIPQIVLLIKDTTGANAISFSMWGFWVCANLTTFLYTIVITKDYLLALMFLGNTIGCAAVLGISIYKRKKYGNLRFFKPSIAKDNDVIDIFAR